MSAPPSVERGGGELLHDMVDAYVTSAHREQAVALFSQMVGAVIVSRAVADVDPALSDEILTANRRQLKRRQHRDEH